MEEWTPVALLLNRGREFMFSKKIFLILLAPACFLLSPAGTKAFDTNTCPAVPNIHFIFRTDDQFTGTLVKQFVESQLTTILGTTPNIVDAGLGTPTIAGVKAACTDSGCTANGAHF